MGNGYCMCKLPQSQPTPSSTISLYHPNNDTSINTPINKLGSLTQHKLKGLPPEIKIMPLDESSFEYLLLKEINLVRSDPSSYANKLTQMLEYITESREVSYFKYPQSDPFILKAGKSLFHNTIDFLKAQSPLPELTWNEELKINIKEDFQPLTEEKIGKLLVAKRLQIKGSYSQCLFSLDFMSNPVLSVVFQLTDETFGQKRRDALLNRAFKDFAVGYTFDPIRKFISILSFA